MPRKKRLTERIYPEILNMDELRSYLRISYDTALGLITSGQIPGKKINREWRINKQDVLNYISSGANR